MSKNEVPVLLLTGYLGSGKTTLVNRILSNTKGIRFAVIVNDIGEVNIDADLIQRGGVVGTQDDSLVALQNGCICCTLKTDLMNQITELIQMRRFDYIVRYLRAGADSQDYLYYAEDGSSPRGLRHFPPS